MEKKYRIYDKLNKEYCEEPDHRWMLSRNGKLYNSENDAWHVVGERFIVEFYTGLHDKNGKEIFCGDVISLPYITPMGDNSGTEDVEKRCHVSYENGTFGLKYYTHFVPLMDLIETEQGEYIPNFGNKIIFKNFIGEIIGNIYTPHQ